MVSASPLTGSVGGGDNVKVAVAGLVIDPPAPVSCFFGELVVRARRTKDEREVLCDIPPHDEGSCGVKRGLRRLSWETGAPQISTCVQAVDVRRIYPARADRRRAFCGGGALVRSLQEDVSCRFRVQGDFVDVEAASMNSSAVRCASITLWYARALIPHAEGENLGDQRSRILLLRTTCDTSCDAIENTSIGNGLLSLTGTNFASGLNPRCRIGDVSVDALRVAASLVTCEAPSGKAGSTVSVGLDVDGVVFGGSQVTYYDEPELVAVSPRIGSRQGGTTIIVQGRGFLNGRGGCDPMPALVINVFHRRALDDVVSCVTPALEDHVEVSLSLSGSGPLGGHLPYQIYEDEPVLLGLSRC